ncbi:MAG TPA: YjbH domain-containing protein [Rhizomicrobium sp.]
MTVSIFHCHVRDAPAKLTMLVAALFLSTSARAQSTAAAPIINLYGSPGLLDMPGAHMAPDGTFDLWTADTGFTQRYGFSFQAFPWLEGTFRYIGTKNLFGAGAYFTGGTYYDRSFGLRIRLQNETGGWPDITMGLDDTIGTGLESGEYFAASKHLGAFDVTVGLGWGRLAGTAMFENPFALVLHSFALRPESTGEVSTSGSILPLKQFFHGPNASLFGGFSWQTPIDGLSLLAEYSSDDYRIEAEQHVFKPAIQVNVGASYQATKSLQLGAAFMYGKTPMVRASYSIDPTTEPFAQRFGAAPLAPHLRSDEEIAKLAGAKIMNAEPVIESTKGDGDTLVVMAQGNLGDCSRYAQVIATARDGRYRTVAIHAAGDAHGKALLCAAADAPNLLEGRLIQQASWQDNGADDSTFVAARARAVELAGAQALEIDAIGLNGDQVDVAFTNAHYRTEPEAYGRLARVLMATMPANVETFRIVSLADGMPTREIVIPRSSLERVIAENGSGSELLPLIPTVQSSESPDEISRPVVEYPAYDWSILPEYNQSLFDPNQPYRYQFLAALSGGIDLTRGLRFETELQGNIVSDFGNLQPSNSVLPHVRSDAVEYYDKGKNGIEDLQGSYATTLAPGVFALARAGILESMFAGGGGEVLWRPDADRWAVGATLYEVWQRGFDRLFDLQPYHVLTGHVSLYYQSPWYGLNFRLDAGRYLAGDKGATLTVSRRFDSGVEIGAFATLTNVPFSQFGEGSFDKGFLITIPLDFMAPLNSQSQLDMNLRPVTRDGGQMLEPEQVLYNVVRRTDYEDFLANVDQIPSP